MKQKLRKDMLNKLNELSLEVRKANNNQIQKNLFNSILWIESNVIGVTVSNQPEWDTYEIIKRAWIENKKVTIPVTNQTTHTIKFYLINSLKDLKEGNYKIYEPINQSIKQYYHKTNVDLIIVPGVVFDEKGYRIGFGKGYFDRYLNDFNNNKISLLAEFQIIKRIPINKYDIKVDCLITEKRIIETK